METILIVDDEKNYPPILAAVMEEEGFEPLMANSGEEDMNILKHSDVDLVLTDMKMPSMDGMEVLRSVKRTNPATEVIILTGHGHEEDRQLCMQLGAFAYLQKPLDINVLSETIQKANEKIRRKKGKKD